MRPLTIKVLSRVGVIVLFCGLLVLIFVLVTLAFRQVQVAERHLIPDGFTGWAITQFNVQDAPPLPMEDGYLVHRYPEDGRLHTSSDSNTGWSKREYYYQQDGSRQPLPVVTWGDEGRIWGRYDGTAISMQRDDGTEQRIGVYSGFFVGTREEYHRSSMPHIMPPGGLPGLPALPELPETNLPREDRPADP